MSPRFQRRPERRSGSGGSSRPADRWNKRGPEGRPAGRSPAPSRGWGAGKPEWKRDSGDSEREPRGERRSGPERPRQRFGERPSGQWRSAERGERSERSGGERSGGERRFGGERSFGERRFGAERRPMGRRDDRGAARSGPRAARFEERRSPRIVDERPQGEAETLGAAPPSDLIWGRHPAEAALESGRPIHRIWCTPELRHTPRFLQLLREAKASGVLVEEVTWARLGQLTGGAVHQGIVLQSAAAETLDLPTLIEGCGQIGEPPLLMAIDGLTDPHNLGAIVRSAEALGAHGMVLPQRRCAGLTGSVAKVAAGALEHLPVARVVNLNRALDTLKQEGYRVVGLAAEGTVTLEEADLEGPLVVVTGSEGDGLSLLTRRSCDQLVRIPLRGSTPSLNASVATALLLFEIARRGWMRGLSGQAPAPRIQRPQLPAPAAASQSPAALEREAIEDPILAVEPPMPSSEELDFEQLPSEAQQTQQQESEAMAEQNSTWHGSDDPREAEPAADPVADADANAEATATQPWPSPTQGPSFASDISL